VQDDLSRGPIPTEDFMKRQIRTLAAYKVNMFALYMEHVFDFASQPLVAPKEAALTPQEIKARWIMPGPLRHDSSEQQTFGHLHHMLKYEIYADVAERPHGHVLTPTKERSYDIIKAMYATWCRCFRGRFCMLEATRLLNWARTNGGARGRGWPGPRLSRAHAESQRHSPALSQAAYVLGRHRAEVSATARHSAKDIIAVPWDYDPRRALRASSNRIAMPACA